MINEDDELRPEYEEGFWEGAVRGKYAGKVVHLAPDVAENFPDDESVNNALRLRIPSEDVGQFFRDSDIIED